MNKRWMTGLLMGTLVLSPFSLVWANDHDTDEMSDKEHVKLGITEDQKAKLKALRESERAAIKPLRDKNQELNKKMAEQVKAKAPEADLKATMSEIETNRNALKDQRESFRAQKAAILTPTQQAQMMVHRQGRMKEHMRKKRGHQKE